MSSTPRKPTRPERDIMHLTQDLVALVERFEPDPGPHPGTSDPTDDDYAQMATALLKDYKPDELWLFAYGSLIWKPAFDVIDQCRAIANGWHRSFCMQLTRWRGTREVPALMLALDRGGSCTGIAYRLPDGDHHKQIQRLLEREVDGNPPTNIARWISVRLPGRTVKALAFVATPEGPCYAGRLPLQEVAAVLARAAGHIGSSAEYLFRTVSKLEEHGIRDRNLWHLQRLVADEIMALKATKLNER